jgi:O-antigen/teichoic acid export membrane protein
MIAPPEYSLAFLIIILSLPSVIMVGIFYFGEVLIKVVYKTHITGIVVTLCAMLSLLLNYIFVPMLGWFGVIITSTFSHMLMGFLTLLIGLRLMPLDMEFRRIIIASGLFLLYLLLFYLLWKTNYIVFYATALIAFIVSIVFLYSDLFCKNHEKEVIKYSLAWLRLKLTL